MRIAILGATSQIARDLIQSFARSNEHELALFARRPAAVVAWLASTGIEKDWDVASYENFTTSQHFETVMNFVGVGNPAQAAAMGATIFEITQHYDELALAYVKEHPNCRYIFLSSGAAYGSTFDEPATENTVARIPVNNLQPQDWYAVAKLHAECRHRALPQLPIVDIRVFNYFSRTQDIEARFLITDILRAIREKTVLKTSPEYIVRDFIHSSDFYELVRAALSKAANVAVDCYSQAPIDKPTLLEAMKQQFGLRYQVTDAPNSSINATGSKLFYYSMNTRAASFGYRPNWTSLENLIHESEILLHKINLVPAP